MSLSIPRAFFHQRSTHGKANDTPRPGPRQCHPSCRCIPTTIAPRPDHESSQAWTSASSGARCEWLTIFSRSPAGPFLHDGEIHRGTFARACSISRATAEIGAQHRIKMCPLRLEAQRVITRRWGCGDVPTPVELEKLISDGSLVGVRIASTKTNA